MKEIITRTLTGIVFIVTVIGSMILHPLAFLIVMGIYAVVGLYEFYKLTIPAKIHPVGFIIGVLSYTTIGLSGLQYIDPAFLMLLAPFTFALIAAELFNNKGSWQNVSYYLASYLYIILPFGLMNYFFFLASDSSNMLLLLSMFVLVWTGDIFAYLTGSFFGKHKLFPRISPKKTWEGSLGGLFFAILASLIIFYFFGNYSIAIWVGYAIILVITSTIGDLAESMLKRNKGVKDSGTLFPGHGGVLDRFDAVIFATPFAYIFLNFVI